MTKLTILKFPDPRLKQVAVPVTEFDKSLAQISADMLETMYEAKGVGLAATQVDIQYRIITVDCSEGRDMPLTLVNPVIKESEGTIFWEEGCLSFPGVYAKVRRYERVVVSYQDISGAEQQIDTDGLLAICLQHEIDHLDGITFYDHLSPLKQKLLKGKIKLLKEAKV